MTTTFHRTNLNLYAEDVAFMQATFGRGWTEQARDIIHEEIKNIKARVEYMNSHPMQEYRFRAK